MELWDDEDVPTTQKGLSLLTLQANLREGLWAAAFSEHYGRTLRL
jgi:hypothetical protein